MVRMDDSEWMAGVDGWRGWVEWMVRVDGWRGWLERMAGGDGFRETLGKWLPLMVECFVRKLGWSQREKIHVVYGRLRYWGTECLLFLIKPEYPSAPWN
jgi:hypothetical protein